MTGTTFVDRDPDLARAAHLLRRTSLAVNPERIEALASVGWGEAVQNVLGQGADQAAGDVPVSEEWYDVSVWWIGQMSSPSSGLLDRMCWFWHGLLTTNAWKVDGGQLVADQLRRLRSNALGNFRTLLTSFVGSGALLQYLDADGSIASNPNENLARELMELFTIGRGHYDQNDVRSAARALAGWRVNEDGEVWFDRSNSFIAPLVFLGEQADWDTALILDRLCDHPATASRVSARLWKHLVGTELDESEAAELGSFWREHDLEILPLVERILTSRSFETERLNKPRSGLEWFCAAQAAIGGTVDDIWQLEHLGESPYLPPNVAGWPDDDRWLAPGSILARSSVTHNLGIEVAVPFDGRAITAVQVLHACGLHAVSPATVAALEAVTEVENLTPEGAHYARWRLALTSPEFNLS